MNAQITNHDQRKFLLASMRVARTNLMTWVAEIDSIGVALRGNLISEETALAWLDELGLLAYLPTGRSRPHDRS
jgi:hypothetical protein